MIAAITGKLVHISADSVHLQAGAMLYDVLVPAVDKPELERAMGTEVMFHTVFYLQGDSGGGGNIEPRLVGFLRSDDKRFFQLFITVKGIGPKKALRALAAPIGEIAHAIESKDARFLVSLPEIGKRTAEQVIAELSGKASAFAIKPAGGKATKMSAPGSSSGVRRSDAEEDAISALLALGERRPDAEGLLDRAKAGNPKIIATDALVREMLRLRTARN